MLFVEKIAIHTASGSARGRWPLGRTKGEFPIVTRGKRSQRKKSSSMNIADLIDYELQRKIVIVENGQRMKATIFEAIYLQLWANEMSGNLQAFKVRCDFDRHAKETSPKKKREIIVRGGLPNDLPRYEEGE